MTPAIKLRRILARAVLLLSSKYTLHFFRLIYVSCFPTVFCFVRFSLHLVCIHEFLCSSFSLFKNCVHLLPTIGDAFTSLDPFRLCYFYFNKFEVNLILNQNIYFDEAIWKWSVDTGQSCVFIASSRQATSFITEKNRNKLNKQNQNKLLLSRVLSSSIS